MTELMTAAGDDDLRRVKPLFSNEGHVDIGGRDGETPLVFWVRDGHTRVVKPFLSRGAKAHARDRIGHTVLMWSVGRWEQPRTVGLLLAAGVQVSMRHKWQSL